MKIIYFQDPRGNFGDEINRWLWQRLFPEHISGYGHHGVETREENNREALLFYGIGTILDSRIPEQPHKIIFGSGYGYGTAPASLNNAQVFFVRGKKTAEALGLSPDKALTDPAILLRKFFPVIPKAQRQYEVSFMPHHSTAHGNEWQQACKALDIHYIDPFGFDIEDITRQIADSRLLIAEAMHGAIIADTFRVPWIPVSSVPETKPFKWQDWCETIGLSYVPQSMTPIFPNRSGRWWKGCINRIKQALRRKELGSAKKARARALLSSDDTLNGHLSRIEEQLALLDSYLKEQGRPQAPHV